MDAESMGAEQRATGRIGVLLVDDDPMVGAFLRDMLGPVPDIQVLATALDGAEAVEAVIRHRPEVVLMDLRMPGVDGVTATAEIRDSAVPSRVVVMTTFNSDEQVVAALRAGASGYLLKTATQDQIVHTIRVVAAGGSALSSDVIAGLVRRPSGPRAPKADRTAHRDLTGRELEVLLQVGAGRSNADIASELYLSEATVKGHVSRLMRKLHCNNRTQLALHVNGH